MNFKHITFALPFAAILVLATACNKQDQTETPETSTNSSVTGAVSSAVTDLKENAEHAAGEVKSAANKAVENTKQSARNFAAGTNNKVETVQTDAQNLIDKARTYISEKKYEDALASLKQLSNFSLTPEQQKTVDDLKAQLQKVMSSEAFTNAASAFGNLFRK